MGWEGGASVAVDNTTVELNASGQIQIKDSGVSTDKIAANAVTLPKFVRTGTSGQVLKSQGASSDAAYGSTGLVLLQNDTGTITANGTANLTAPTLTGYKKLYLVFRMKATGGASNQGILFRINNDTGANYNTFRFNGTTAENATGQTAFNQLQHTAGSGPVSGELLFHLDKNASDHWVINGTIKGHDVTGGYHLLFPIAWKQTADITSFTLQSQNSVTWEYTVTWYGMV